MVSPTTGEEGWVWQRCKAGGGATRVVGLRKGALEFFFCLGKCKRNVKIERSTSNFKIAGSVSPFFVCFCISEVDPRAIGRLITRMRHEANEWCRRSIFFVEYFKKNGLDYNESNAAVDNFSDRVKEMSNHLFNIDMATGHPRCEQVK